MAAIITINNDPNDQLAENALKIGTKQLMKGFNVAKAAWKKDASRAGAGFGKSTRKKVAESIRQQKGQWGSAKIRKGFKDIG